MPLTQDFNRIVNTHRKHICDLILMKQLQQFLMLAQTILLFLKRYKTVCSGQTE